jgi:hypothetical protein
MKQQDLVFELYEQGMSAFAIHIKLVDIFGPLAMAYSSVTRMARSASWTGNSSAKPGRSPNEEFDKLQGGP